MVDFCSFYTKSIVKIFQSYFYKISDVLQPYRLSQNIPLLLFSQGSSDLTDAFNQIIINTTPTRILVEPSKE